MTDPLPLLRMSGICKRFPGVQALQEATLDVVPGEVHILLGENGAGKSTLMKVLCGQYAADRGSISFAGETIAPESPIEAERIGLVMIHQELNLIPGLTVAENIFLGHEPTRSGFILADIMRTTSRELLRRVRCGVDPDAPVAHLSVAQRGGSASRHGRTDGSPRRPRNRGPLRGHPRPRSGWRAGHLHFA